MKFLNIELQPGVFIDEDYEARYTDILYRVEMDKQPGYLFVLTEHQSNPDPLMAFRLWNYLCKIWDRHLAELDHERKTDKKKTKAKDMKLPLIYPLTVYHGKITPYPFSMDLFDLFQKKELARDILLSPFPLIDLTIIPDDEILRHQHAAVMELIQKHIFQRNIQEAIEQLKQHGHLALIHDLNHGQYFMPIRKVYIPVWDWRERMPLVL